MKERPILFSGAMVRAILEGRKTQTRRVVKGPIGYLGGQGGESDLSSWGWFFDGPQHHGYMVLARGMNQRHDHGCISIPCPYGQTGDRLWVRETWAYNGQSSKNYGPTESRREGYVTYAADGVRKTLVFPEGPMLDAPKQHVPVRGEGEDEVDHAVRVDAYYKDYFRRSRPSIFMPRWASRLTLEVTEVRVQRLQEISEEDARAEGVEPVISEHWTAYDPDTEGYPSFGVEPDAETIVRKRLENVRHHGPKVISTAREQFERLWDSINGAREGCSWVDNPWVWCVSFRRVA